MTFSLIPVEIKNEIVSFSFRNPTKITIQEVINSGRSIVNLSKTNKGLKNICQQKLADLKKIHDLIMKYSAYNSDYENPGTNWDTGGKINPGGNPQLYDALLTGCTLPYAKHSFADYSTQIEEDIKTIVKLTPQSMNFILGKLRCRDEVLPIVAACMNKNIPTSIVEFLLKSGANPKATIKVDGRPVKIIKDLKANISDERYKIIFNLFKQYGMDSA